MTPSRRAAFAILARVETQSSFATDLLAGPLTRSLSEPDAALCTELVMGTLRWQGTLDFIAQRFARKWDSLDPEVRVALRLGIYQIQFLCRIPGRMPVRAALFETVEAVKSAGKRSAAGLVNAVLRKVAEEMKTIPGTAENGEADLAESVRKDLARLRPAGIQELDWLAIEYSHPAWLLERWIARYGRLAALALACSNNASPPVFLRLNPRGRSEAELEKDLGAQGMRMRPGTLLQQSRSVVQGNISRTEAFRRREVVVQDEASQMVPYLVDVRPGDRVLDLCAAPGNKTAQLAERAGASGFVVACDIHLRRLERMAALASDHLLRVAVDGTRPLPFRAAFDRILVDAPCSGTGTLRRHPEIKWRLAGSDLRDLAAKQLQLLQSAAPLLAPGGRLVYSTCSLEYEENDAVIGKFLANHPEFRLLPLREDASRLQPFLRVPASQILENDFFRTLPARDGADGFFGAVLAKG